MRTNRTAAAVALAVLLALSAGCGGGGDGAVDDPGVTASTSAAVGGGERGVVAVSTLDGEDCPQDTADADFPDVVGATFTPVDGEPRRWQVAATLCSLYDTPARYADAWRVATPDGVVVGTRELLHDHAGEQPFTRSLAEPVTVPDAVTTVVVEARDQVNGWGGAVLEVDLTRD